MARAAPGTGTGTIPVLSLVLLLVAGACGIDEDAPPRGRETISRETFIATFVELRRSALESETGQITDEERERILSEHEITEDDLVTFVDVHGGRIDFMRDIWTEVETRVLGSEEGDTAKADTAGADTTHPGPDPRPGQERPTPGSG